MKTIFLFIIVSFSISGLKAQIREINIIQLDSLIKVSSQPLIVNFWATWCAPCLEELPYMQKVAEKERVLLVLVNMDNRSNFENKLEGFVKSRKIIASHFWLNETNADYFCPFIAEEWNGSIPATLFINNKKKLRIFKEEKLEEEELGDIVKKMLN